tara:strand:- start:11359 stop:12057 length:699 start_codon:yes stop_codon:yes gene_type:complete
MEKTSDLFVYDEWLADVMNKPTFSLRNFDDGDSICLPNGNSFIYAKVPTDSVSKLVLLQQMGFYIVETNVQFILCNPNLENGIIEARFAQSKDCTAVQALAREAFYFDRFHQDPRISNEVASNVKQEWVANFFSGNRGEWMVVVEDTDGIKGFLQVLNDNYDGLTIDLIAVKNSLKRQGIGRAMIAFAANTCLATPKAIKVGTQIANIASVRMYLDLGFKLTSATYTLHYHS